MRRQGPVLSLVVLLGCLLGHSQSWLLAPARPRGLAVIARSTVEPGKSSECCDEQQTTTNIKGTTTVCSGVPSTPFVLDLSNPEPTAAELEHENIAKILKLECTDEQANMLTWKCLGYRFNPAEDRWDNTNVFPKWRERFPNPPDVLGVTRIYEREVDEPVKKANQALVRSIPKSFKQSLKDELAPYGFKGYKFAELTPNKTRRAQVANWLLYFRGQLWGKSLDQLLKEKDEVIQVTRDGETPEQLAKKMVY